jgi:hypothetical protein
MTHSPKDNDELRDYEQYVHWQFVALLRSLRLSANLSPAQEQLIKAKARLVAATIGEDISTHVVRALERARMWEQYAGDYDKRYYDIKLWSGEVYENCWPNANTFHEGVIGKLIEGKDVAYVRPSQTPQLNHQKSQKEGE